MNLILKLWQHPFTRSLDINSNTAVLTHRAIIEQKPFLRAIYRNWYREFLVAYEKVKALGLPLIEIGSGAGHLEEYIPEVVKSDVVENPNAHRVIDATALPYKDRSVAAIFVLNAFHHFPEPEAFLKEADRCLVKGGFLVLTEPSGSPLQSFMIKKFHPHEYYDESITDWKNDPKGRLGSCNNAIPYIVFERDQEKLKAKFPRLKIRSFKKHTYFIYFLSGGLSYKSFLPKFTLPLVLGIEKAMALLFPNLGTEMTITFEKI